MIRTNLGSYLDDEIPVITMGEAGAPQDLELQNVPAPVVETESPAQEPPVVESTPIVEPVITPAVIDEGAVFTFLKEKAGIEVTSLEDLKPKAAPERDPRIKAIEDWAARTGRPLEDWVKYSRDLSTLSEVDVVRENIKLAYPTLTDAEVELELSSYIATEDDLESEVAMKNLKLKKEATVGRAKLDSLRLDLDTANAAAYPKEVQADLALAQQLKTQQANAVQATQVYNAGLQTAATTLDTVPLKLSDTLTIDFTLPAEEKSILPRFVNEMPHWVNADGTDNHQAIIRDAVIIRNHEKMLRAAYEQGVASGTEAVAVAASNITLNTGHAAQPASTSGYTVEGFGKLMGGSIRIGRK